MKMLTIFDVAKIIEKIGMYHLFKINNISYLEIRPSKFIDGVEIKIADMSNEDNNKWEYQERTFTYTDLMKML